jgi:hypothetical protein
MNSRCGVEKDKKKQPHSVCQKDKLSRLSQVKLLAEFDETSQESTLDVHVVRTLNFTAQNGCQSLEKKNLVQLSQVKMLVGFQRNFTGLMID